MQRPSKFLLASLCLNLALGALLWRARGRVSALPASAVGWYHQASQEAFGQMPSFGPLTVFAGDSITTEAPWEELLCGVLNRGVKGERVEGLRQRLGEITSRKPEELVILIGINDLISGSAPEQVAREIDALLLAARHQSPDTQIWLSSILPVVEEHWGEFAGNQKIGETNQRLRVIAKKRSVHFLELHELLVSEAGELLPELSHDGLHLMPAGYALLRPRLKQALLRFEALEVTEDP